MEALLQFILSGQIGSMNHKDGKSRIHYSFDGERATWEEKDDKFGGNWPVNCVYDVDREYVLILAIERLMDSKKLYAVVAKHSRGVEVSALALCSEIEMKCGEFYASDAAKRIAESQGL